jgi:hypothetical protein
LNSTTANIFKQIADLYKACFWRRCWSIQEASSSVVVVTGLTSHANTICRLALNNMSFHLNICVTTNLLQQRPTASINIHTWITYSYSCLSFWVHAWYQFVISLHQIWYSNQNLALNNMSFHFGDICVTTQLLQQRPTSSITFIWESHYIREHSYSCLYFWVHALYPFVVSFFHVWFSKLSFIQLYVHILAGCTEIMLYNYHTESSLRSSAWRCCEDSSLAEDDQVAQYHVYLNHCTYVNIHIRVCHFDFMLYTDLSYRVHAFHLFIV